MAVGKTHMARMLSRERWRAFEAQPWVQSVEFAIGMLLIIISPLAGPIPGPGGLPILVAGLTLVLRTSIWAKRRYVHFKRWQPKAGRWTDWGLRRESAKRREAIAKAERAEAAAEPSIFPEQR